MRNSAFLLIVAAVAAVLAYSAPVLAQAAAPATPPAAAQPPARGYYDFFAQKTTGEPWEALLGKPAPSVNLKMLGGGTFDLASFQGKKVVVMDFWASWCPPCRLLMPVFNEVAKTFKGKDVVFVSVNQAEPVERVKAFIDSNKFDVPVALDTDGDASQAYKVDSIPRLVLVAKDGTVQSIHAGLEGRDVKSVQENARKKITDEVNKLLAGERLALPKPSQPTQEAKEQPKTEKF